MELVVDRLEWSQLLRSLVTVGARKRAEKDKKAREREKVWGRKEEAERLDPRNGTKMHSRTICGTFPTCFS